MAKKKLKADAVIEQITKKKNLPILVEYEPFNSLYKLGANNQIKKIVKELTEVVKVEKRYKLELKNLEKEKQRITARVIYYSGQVNDPMKGSSSDYDNLEIERVKINAINDRVDKNRKEIKELIVKKEELNLLLLKETIMHCYENMGKDEKKLQDVLKKIEVLRKQLEEKRVERDTYKERIDSTYSFIHGLMGSRTTEKIDSKLIDNGKK